MVTAPGRGVGNRRARAFIDTSEEWEELRLLRETILLGIPSFVIVANYPGAVALTCATGGTMMPAGYTCSFGSSSVMVSGGPATTSLNLTLAWSSAAGVKTARRGDAYGMLNGALFAGALLLLGLLGRKEGERRGRNFIGGCGFVLGAFSTISACGGGGGSGGRPAPKPQFLHRICTSEWERR